jgi:hypothetical protein
MVKAVGSSRSLGAASQQSSWQEVITQHDTYYQKWFAS